MQSSEIRSRFLEFFENNSHRILASAPLLPSDPDLLFNIAGMVPFKPYFLAEETAPSPRVATSQKCIRTADIDNVGHTARHLTFFEMLGNFSFGDYFKEEAIKLGWQFLTEEMGLDEDRLWVSVFGGDDQQGLEADEEAEKFWRDTVGVDAEKILRFGTSENFWAMGPTGPCGPCSEILYDQKEKNADPREVKELIESGDDRVLELWNLVFMQFNRFESGDLEPLPQQNIDTGLGLERLAAVMQGGKSNFETDLFIPLIEAIKQLSAKSLDSEDKKAAPRIIADHLRAASFLLAEGLLPGNEGRGYVLRRLIRRALRWGRELGFDEPFMYKLVDEVVEMMGDHYEELKNNRQQIIDRLHAEEKQFNRTLDQGMVVLQQKIDELAQSGESSFSGEEIFKLYETYGFPVEITAEILRDKNIDFNLEEVEKAKKVHQEKSRAAVSESEAINLDTGEIETTEFVGYNSMETIAEVVAVFKEGNKCTRLEAGEEGQVVLDRTPFYAEQGGQIGDTGKINGFVVENTTVSGGSVLHYGSPTETIKVGEEVRAVVNKNRRRAIMRHHTSTHLLQAALRDCLGSGVMQSGSFVGPDHLRFDFTHARRVEAEELKKIEEQVNSWIYAEVEVESREMSKEAARQEGALAFFGDHYGERVRVITIENSDFSVSKEFCGGTHVENTGLLGPFVITDESSVSAGVRRIEAKAGGASYEFLDGRRQLLDELRAVAGVQRVGEIENRFLQLKEKLDDYELRLDEYRRRESKQHVSRLRDDTQPVGEVNLLVKEFSEHDPAALEGMIDRLREEIEKGVILLINKKTDSVQLLLAVSDELTSEIQAGDLVNRLGRLLGGGGGGRPTFAQAGGQNLEALPRVKEEIIRIIEEQSGPAAGD